MHCFCRIILAVAHFNHNLNRKIKKRLDGTERLKVQYPKYKNGEATIKGVPVEQNFGECYSLTYELLNTVKV